MHLPFHDARSAHWNQLVDLLTDVQRLLDCHSCRAGGAVLRFRALVCAGDQLKVAHSQIARLLLHRSFVVLLVGGRLKVLLAL